MLCLLCRLDIPLDRQSDKYCSDSCMRKYNKNRYHARIRGKVNEGYCSFCGLKSASQGKMCEDCKNYCKKQGKIYRARIKREVIKNYGDRCKCCDLDDWRFLSIDHIYNDGAAHRRKLKNST